MSNPRDEIDAWLDRDVEPLAPPPGTFKRIRKRARRRKAGRAMAAAAGAAVVIAAVAAVPRMTAVLQQGDKSPARPSVAVGQLPSPTLTIRPGTGGGTIAAKSETEVPAPASSLSTSTSGYPVPKHFRPTSITLISSSVGAVIGQAGKPGHCATRYCTSLAGTASYGGSWYGVSAPLTGAPRGPTGVSQLRFLNLSYGWAFGPALYATTDGGANWAKQNTFGLRVTDLETAGDRAFALFASCGGSGSGYAAQCTSFALYSSAAGTAGWQQVPVPAPYVRMTGSAAGQAAAASLVLAAGTGYVLAPSGTLLSGPLTGAPWKVVGQIPPSCHIGTAQLSGQPAGAQLASGTSVASEPQLLLACDGAASAGGGSQPKIIYTSATNGASWQEVGPAPSNGTATSLAASSAGLVVLATSAGISYSADSGKSWTSATFTAQASAGAAAAPAGGFSYVGMTDPAQGVAVPANPKLGEVFITLDGGHTWRPSPIKGG